LENFLNQKIKPIDDQIKITGIGMIWGIDLSKFNNPSLVKNIGNCCFDRGLIIERVGREDTVLKILPPLNIEMSILQQGCSIIQEVLIDCLTKDI
jgi:diaminobutyrate-2-oxoglutarate transaminase